MIHKPNNVPMSYGNNKKEHGLSLLYFFNKLA